MTHCFKALKSSIAVFKSNYTIYGENIRYIEQLLFLYKTEDKGISLEQFCINNGINYRAIDITRSAK